MNLVIRPRARDDIIRQFRWYLVQQDAADTGYQFLDSLEESVQQLLHMPHMGAPKALKEPALEGLRSWPVKGFKEIYIFYVTEGETVRIIRVLHGRRDLGRVLSKRAPTMTLSNEITMRYTQNNSQGSLSMKLFTALFACATLCLAAPKVEPKTEIGEINGAKFRIDIPDNWNGGLVMYCHGYSPVAGAYKDGKLPPVLAVFTEQGYALAQSGYAAGGWAIQEAVEDTEALRRYFTGKYGQPKETFITGHSMGGFLTMMFMERFGTSYDAGLALCGPLAPTTYFMDRGAFDLRVVFDYYFPGALPAPDKVPADFKNTPELDKKIQALMDSQPEKAAALLHYSGAHSTKDLAGTLGFVTYLLLDMEQRGGGNPFDNRNMIYESPDDYNALNDGVKRYKADPRAAEYMRNWYTPTGKLSRPMLAIHTTYDPLVPVRIPERYSELVEQTGSQDLFVQQYVKHDGHCTILPNETAAGFSELRAWKDQGTKPHAGLHPEIKTASSGQSKGSDR